MTKTEAMTVLQNAYGIGICMIFESMGELTTSLDGNFGIKELQALIWIMENEPEALKYGIPH